MWVSLPMMFPTQYDTRYIAATVVFLVQPSEPLENGIYTKVGSIYVPATFVDMSDKSATNGVGLAWV